MIEILTFRLAGGVDEDEFLAADRRVQTEFAYQQPGLLRRTTARGENGDWVVIDVWQSVGEADASEKAWESDPAAMAFMELVDRSTVRVARYHEID